MSDVVVYTQYMNLPNPVPVQSPGPNYANDIYSCLTVVDQHTHALGSGVQITPAGLNISTDLPFLSNNATMLRSVRFTPQSAPLSGVADIGCIYESGVDLWYNDGSANQIRITASGGVAGSPGSISNLTSPASANYSSGTSTFVWESGANLAANMDFGSAILRNLTVSSFGLTLSPPVLSSDYTITLPTLPVSATSFLTIDTSGNMASGVPVSSVLTTSSTNITNSNIASNADISISKIGPNTAVSLGASTGTQNFSGSGIVTLATVTITTVRGSPVWVGLLPDGGTAATVFASDTGASGQFTLFCGSTSGQPANKMSFVVSDTANQGFTPPGLFMIDQAAAGTPGTYTYTFAGNSDGTTNVTVFNLKLAAYEI